MNSKLPEKFCIYPWVHTQIDNDGSLLTCCEVKYSDRMALSSEQSLEQAWNSESYKEARRKMLAGEILKQCQGCIMKEAAGHESDRLKANKWYKDNFENVALTSKDGELPLEALKSLDLRVSNTCNFKCRTCTPASSTALAKEWPLVTPQNIPPINRQAFESKEETLNYLKPALLQLEKLYCAGGEPFLQLEVFEVLDYLIENDRAQHVELFYNTNLSIDNFAGRNIVYLLNKFKRVTLNLSLDDYGERGEYVRDGLVWKDFVKRLNHFQKSLNNAEIYINVTISNLNSFYLPEFLNECFNELKMSREDIFFNPVTHPEYYHLANLPPRLKEKVVKKLELFLEKGPQDVMHARLSAMINLIKKEHDPKYLKVFKQMTVRLDQIRSQSFLTLFPELDELLEG